MTAGGSGELVSPGVLAELTNESVWGRRRNSRV